MAAASVLLLLAAAPLAAQSTDYGEIWLDGTTSLDMETRDGTLDHILFESVPELAETANIQRWRFYAFGGGATFAALPFHTMTLPVVPKHECEPEPPSKLEILMAGVARRAAARREAECKRKRQAAREAFEQERDVQLRQGREAAARAVPEDSDRTCLIELLSRVTPTESGVPTPVPRVLVVITDGIETCQPARAAPLPAPAVAADVFLAIVPEDNPRSRRTTGQHFAAMVEHWGTVAPWVTVVPAFAAAESIVQQIHSGTDAPLPSCERVADCGMAMVER